MRISETMFLTSVRLFEHLVVGYFLHPLSGSVHCSLLQCIHTTSLSSRPWKWVQCGWIGPSQKIYRTWNLEQKLPSSVWWIKPCTGYESDSENYVRKFVPISEKSFTLRITFGPILTRETDRNPFRPVEYSVVLPYPPCLQVHLSQKF